MGNHYNQDSIDESSLDVDQAITVCKVREDGELALRLQKEEEERHYARNIEIRQLAIHDLKKAKELQEAEDRKHQEWTRKREEENLRKAAYIQQKYYRRDLEEKERKERIERMSQRKAVELAEKDEKKRKQLEKLQVINDQKMAEQMLANMRMDGKRENNRSHRKTSYTTDEEIARRMYLRDKQELERRKVEKLDKNKALLLQDEELARHIHERELKEASDNNRLRRPQRPKQPPGRSRSRDELQFARHEKEKRSSKHQRDDPRLARDANRSRSSHDDPHRRSYHQEESNYRSPGNSRDMRKESAPARPPPPKNTKNLH